MLDLVLLARRYRAPSSLSSGEAAVVFLHLFTVIKSKIYIYIPGLDIFSIADWCHSACLCASQSFELLCNIPRRICGFAGKPSDWFIGSHLFKAKNMRRSLNTIRSTGYSAVGPVGVQTRAFFLQNLMGSRLCPADIAYLLSKDYQIRVLRNLKISESLFYQGLRRPYWLQAYGW